MKSSYNVKQVASILTRLKSQVWFGDMLAVRDGQIQVSFEMETSIFLCYFRIRPTRH